MKAKLPKYMHRSRGRYYFVKWDGVARKVRWHPIGTEYAEALHNLATIIDAPAQEKPLNMADVFEKFRIEVLQLKAYSTQKGWRSLLKQLELSFAEVAPERVTPQMIYKYHAARSSKARISANREVTLLGLVFKHAIRWGLAVHNPAAGLMKNNEMPRQRYINDAELGLLLENTSGYLHNTIRLAYITGQRIGDLLRVRWSDVQTDGIHIAQQKTGRALIIEVTPALADILADCKGGKVHGQTVLADAKGQAISYARIQHPFHMLVMRLVESGAMASRVTVHDLRRKAGSDTPLESRLLGHASTKIRERTYYARPLKVSPVK